MTLNRSALRDRPPVDSKVACLCMWGSASVQVKRACLWLIKSDSKVFRVDITTKYYKRLFWRPERMRVWIDDLHSADRFRKSGRFSCSWLYICPMQNGYKKADASTFLLTAHTHTHTRTLTSKKQKGSPRRARRPLKRRRHALPSSWVRWRAPSATLASSEAVVTKPHMHRTHEHRKNHAQTHTCRRRYWGYMPPQRHDE